MTSTVNLVFSTVFSNGMICYDRHGCHNIETDTKCENGGMPRFFKALKLGNMLVNSRQQEIAFRIFD